MGYEYRNEPAFAETTRAMQICEDDADDLRSPIAAMRTQIGLLELLMKRVQTAGAEDALAEAISHLEDAIGTLRIAADEVVENCED